MMMEITERNPEIKAALYVPLHTLAIDPSIEHVAFA
jgi:hypothetical protein